MYRKKSRGWYKHKDFILIDLACLFMALILAYLIRNGSVRNLFTLGIYRNVMIFVILVDLFLIILFESYKGVLRRGRYQELRSVIRQMILIELASGLYLFTVSGGHTFSRIILYLMGIFYVLLSYCTRIIWKKLLLHKMAEGGEHSLYIVTNYDLASKVIQNVKEHNYNRYNINGLILIDKDMTGKEIVGVPVVADLNNAPSFICQQWVDEVFVNVDETYPYPQELIEELLEMGMPVHVNLAKVRSTPGQKQFVEAIGGYTVLTTTMNYATDRQALAKRALDILGGLVGCFLTGIIFIFIAPAIYISSPGPIFFSQTRIGKNGKPFKMYKFRSMYMDAEERKAELMAQNKMSDGRMFKLDFDPRVIGNKILPDGTRKTGIGEFIRKTSLDEFPQFWNVLNGSMSLVGTRPIREGCQYLLLYLLLLCQDAGLYRNNSTIIRNIIFFVCIIFLMIWKAKIKKKEIVYFSLVALIMVALRFYHHDAQFIDELMKVLEHLLVRLLLRSLYSQNVPFCVLNPVYASGTVIVAQDCLCTSADPDHR